MNCKFVRKNLVGIVEGELPSEVRKKVEAHLQSCNRCADLVERFAQTWQAWENPSGIGLSPRFWTRLEQRISAAEGKEPLPFARNGQRWLRPIAALATILIGIFFGYQLGSLSTPRSVQSAQQVNSAVEKFVDENLGSLYDFPAGSVGEFYVSLGQNN